MEISRERLSRYYSSQSDEELLALDRSELTELAQVCYDEEIAKRGLTAAQEAGAEWDQDGEPRTADEQLYDDTWLETACCVCAFEAHPGALHSSDAEQAQKALEAAGIPCHIVIEEIAGPEARHGHGPRYECRVMVPGPLSLEASSVLDLEIFNPRLEAEWRAHFENLTNEELLSFDGRSITAGLLDRAARLKKAYTDEVARRNVQR